MGGEEGMQLLSLWCALLCNQLRAGQGGRKWGARQVEKPQRLISGVVSLNEQGQGMLQERKASRGSQAGG